MMVQREDVLTFVRLVESGASLEAMERYYAPDVVIFENRELARAGRAQAVAYEREALASLREPARVKALRVAVDEDDGVVFIEWKIRFIGESGRPMLLEEVGVQAWENGLIVSERFYYQGFVDEGDVEEEASGTDEKQTA